MDLDRRGIPGGFIASEEFRDAAVAQAESLGFDAPRMFVGHPIQDRTDDEMRSLAESAYDQVVALIVEPGSSNRDRRTGIVEPGQLNR